MHFNSMSYTSMFINVIKLSFPFGKHDFVKIFKNFMNFHFCNTFFHPPVGSLTLKHLVSKGQTGNFL